MKGDYLLMYVIFHNDLESNIQGRNEIELSARGGWGRGCWLTLIKWLVIAIHATKGVHFILGPFSGTVSCFLQLVSNQGTFAQNPYHNTFLVIVLILVLLIVVFRKRGNWRRLFAISFLKFVDFMGKLQSRSVIWWCHRVWVAVVEVQNIISSSCNLLPCYLHLTIFCHQFLPTRSWTCHYSDLPNRCVSICEIYLKLGKCA